MVLTVAFVATNELALPLLLARATMRDVLLAVSCWAFLVAVAVASKCSEGERGRKER
jgi:hypothetical protein